MDMYDQLSTFKEENLQKRPLRKSEKIAPLSRALRKLGLMKKGANMSSQPKKTSNL